MLRIAPCLFACALAVSGADLAHDMDTFLQAHAKLKGFMGTVLVAKDGKVLFEKGYGYANLELNVPNTPANKFRLGSITKQFTAASVLQLAEAGQLSVSDLACKYVENCPETWKPITIRHLLTHTSGIPSYTGMPAFPTPKFMRIPLSPLEIVMLSKDKPLDFKPGEGWKYDNTGYVLLGYIIEKVSGRNYADYLKENILDKLGMADSGYDDTRAILPGRVAGYDRVQDKYRNADYLDMSLPYAAGSLYSTVEDLYKWQRALAAGKVVSAKSYQAMTTPVSNNYGYGLMIDRQFNRAQIGHGGGINGFSTCISGFPDEEAVVIVLANVVSSNSCGIGSGLSAILFVEKYDMPRTYTQVPIDPKLLDRFTGKYAEKALEMNITSDTGHLFAQLKGQPKFEVFPSSTHEFFLTVVDAALEFEPADAIATQVILIQNGRRITLARVP